MTSDREDQCASFKPLLVHFGKRPLTAGQSELSALVVDSPKTYDTMVQANPGKNTSQGPPAKKTIGRKKREGWVEKTGGTTRSTLKRTTSRRRYRLLTD